MCIQYISSWSGGLSITHFSMTKMHLNHLSIHDLSFFSYLFNITQFLDQSKIAEETKEKERYNIIEIFVTKLLPLPYNTPGLFCDYNIYTYYSLKNLIMPHIISCRTQYARAETKQPKFVSIVLNKCFVKKGYIKTLCTSQD